MVSLDWKIFEPLVEIYWPQSQWANAACLLQAEVEASANACQDPVRCVQTFASPKGPVNTFGLFQIGDVDWAPGKGANTPFTAEEWANVLDPNVNIWMASVVWSIAGWRAWDTCTFCQPDQSTPICLIPGGPIPHPRHPISLREQDGFVPYPLIAVGVSILTGLAILTMIDVKTGGRV